MRTVIARPTSSVQALHRLKHTILYSDGSERTHQRILRLARQIAPDTPPRQRFSSTLRQEISLYNTHPGTQEWLWDHGFPQDSAVPPPYLIPERLYNVSFALPIAHTYPQIFFAALQQFVTCFLGHNFIRSLHGVLPEPIDSTRPFPSEYRAWLPNLDEAKVRTQWDNYNPTDSSDAALPTTILFYYHVPGVQGTAWGKRLDQYLSKTYTHHERLQLLEQALT